MATDWIADIGGLSLLRVASLDQLLADYRKSTGKNATGLLVPLFSPAGPNWRSQLFPTDKNEMTYGAPDLAALSKECETRKLDLWLEIVPTMGFAATSSCQVSDQRNASSARCCITSPGTRKAFSLLLDELRTSAPLTSVKGVVLTAQDFWPMGATENFIEITCFCPYCSRYYAENGLSLDPFKYYPSPLNLVIKNSGTGLSHIYNLDEKVTETALVDYSRAGGFLAAEMASDLKPYELVTASKEWPRLKEWASLLISFIRKRQEISFAGMEFFVGKIRETFPKVPVAVAIDDLSYDWTSGFFFQSVAASNICDEIWTTPLGASKLGVRPSRIYACERARYFVQALYDVLELSWKKRAVTAARNPLVFRNEVASRAEKLKTATLSNPLAFQTLDLPENCHGVVAPTAPENLPDLVSELLDLGGIEGAQDEIALLRQVSEALQRRRSE